MALPSPAARAGVQPGDELLAIGGARLPVGLDSEMAASMLRGAPGSRVTLKLRLANTPPIASAAEDGPGGIGDREVLGPATSSNSSSVMIPGVPSRTRTVVLKREHIELR